MFSGKKCINGCWVAYSILGGTSGPSLDVKTVVQLHHGQITFVPEELPSMHMADTTSLSLSPSKSHTRVCLVSPEHPVLTSGLTQQHEKHNTKMELEWC